MILRKVINCLSFFRLPWRALWIAKTLTEGGPEEHSCPRAKDHFSGTPVPIKLLESSTKPSSSITRIVKNASADTNCASARSRRQRHCCPRFFRIFWVKKASKTRRDLLCRGHFFFLTVSTPWSRYKGTFQMRPHLRLVERAEGDSYFFVRSVLLRKIQSLSPCFRGKDTDANDLEEIVRINFQEISLYKESDW